MPKQRITKEMVVDAAFEIARRYGVEKATVKAIAEKLGCSVQPIYSYCRNMDGLRNDVAEKAREFVQGYVGKSVDQNDLFCSTGHAFVQIAREEPHIFRLYLFHQRTNIASLDDLYRAETSPAVAQRIAQTLNLSMPAARRLHLNMLIYTIGIGTIFSVTSPAISETEIFAQQEQAYQAFLQNAVEGEKNEAADFGDL